MEAFENGPSFDSMCARTHVRAVNNACCIQDQQYIISLLLTLKQHSNQMWKYEKRGLLASYSI